MLKGGTYMWLDKNNIETIYAPEKRNYKKELLKL